ncbi:hypothetical protein [Luteolibacter luteus]|uniref:Uncharacterized protein n=1 Tax=Luteolibacter luteus TaxID=2728835 RepID=A0A858RRF5_9BACT|nr:hypothetical protein [Luteolibacter luteus]QJE99124.1 hypothetical protein HHL09_26205 [Luteolibacter luteus]
MSEIQDSGVSAGAAVSTVVPEAGGSAGAPPALPASPAGFFRDEYATEGRFREGWAEKFSELGLHRLASKAATAKDEATLFRMLDDTIGHASKRAMTRPGERASEQELAEYRRATGAPEASDGYAFLSEGLPEGATRDELMAGKVESLLHKHHAPRELAGELASLYMEAVGGMQQRGAQVMEARIAEREAGTTELLREQYGEDFERMNAATKEFLASHDVDVSDPLMRYALLHPQLARIVNEARLAGKERGLPGVGRGIFSGSGSPREQAQKIMREDPQWRKNPAKFERVRELYARG